MTAQIEKCKNTLFYCASKKRMVNDNYYLSYNYKDYKSKIFRLKFRGGGVKPYHNNINKLFFILDKNLQLFI